MPENWEITKLGNIIDFKNGKKRPKTKGDIPVYGGNGILDYVSEYNKENSIVIGRVGAYAGSTYYEPSKLWVSDNAISAKNKENSDIVFDYYLLSSLKLSERQIGTGQPLLTQSILNNIEVLLPTYSEQIEIGKMLKALDNQIDNNRKINHHLAA